MWQSNQSGTTRNIHTPKGIQFEGVRMVEPTAMLPKNFWYDGMFKVKAGKGYLDLKGGSRVVGPLSGPCSECDGTVVSIKMNTSSKGFETTSEKVCNKCGLVVPGAFQVLESKPDYKSKYYATHEEWMEDMKPSHKSNEDVAWDNELYEHKTGKRPNTSDDVGYGGAKFGDQFANINDDYPPRMRLAISRLAKTPASIKMDKQEWRKREYHTIADDYIHMLELNKLDAADVHWHIDNHGVTQLTRYGKANVDDLIYHLCILYGKVDKRKCVGYNKYLYDLLQDKYL